jgi:hypothetical protein
VPGPRHRRAVLAWFRPAEVEALCCTRTGLPYAQDFRHPAGRYLVANNGCVGLPGLAGRHHGVLTRISVLPGVPGDSLHGLTMAGLRFDALPVEYDHSRWITHFADAWPPGSPARRNYHHRIELGTWLIPGHAARGTVTCPPEGAHHHLLRCRPRIRRGRQSVAARCRLLPSRIFLAAAVP